MLYSEKEISHQGRILRKTTHVPTAQDGPNGGDLPAFVMALLCCSHIVTLVGTCELPGYSPIGERLVNSPFTYVGTGTRTARAPQYGAQRFIYLFGRAKVVDLGTAPNICRLLTHLHDVSAPCVTATTSSHLLYKHPAIPSPVSTRFAQIFLVSHHNPQMAKRNLVPNSPLRP